MNEAPSMPGGWAAERELFLHQIGFTCPPHDRNATLHESLRESIGPLPQSRRHVEIDAAPERVHQVARRMRAHYDRLHAHRIRQ